MFDITGITIPGQSGPGNENGNEEVFLIPKAVGIEP